MAIGNVPDFWGRVCAAPARFLGLDYDGTLAPFHIDPMEARPQAGVIDLLRALVHREGTAVAIISGRPAAQVSMLLDHLPVTIVGSHGFELWSPTNGKPLVHRSSVEQETGLVKAEEAARHMGYDDKLEHKVASIAMHTRGVPAQLALAMEESIVAAWTEIASLHPLECRRFNGGVEIRCSGRHKGDALAELLRAEPRGALAVYVGDDETDEDAFRIIRKRGIGIRVGQGFPSTAAQGSLQDCEAVKKFLETWVSVTSTLRS